MLKRLAVVLMSAVARFFGDVLAQTSKAVLVGIVLLVFFPQLQQSVQGSPEAREWTASSPEA